VNGELSHFSRSCLIERDDGPGDGDADIKYIFTNAFKGLEAQLLIVGKIDNGETYNNNKFIFNKENTVRYNFILNYHF